MSEVIYFELKVFLVFALHGICLLFGSDLLRSWRIAVPHGGVWTGIEDMIFWFAAGVWTFVLIFIYQDGILRLYMAAAMGMGMFFYRKTVSRWVVKGVSGGLLLVLRFVSFLVKKIDIFCQKVVAKSVKKG